MSLDIDSSVSQSLSTLWTWQKICPTAYFKSLRKIFHKKKPVLITCYGHVWEFFIIYLEMTGRESFIVTTCALEIFPLLPLKNLHTIPFFSRSTPSLAFFDGLLLILLLTTSLGTGNRFSRRLLMLTLNSVSHLAMMMIQFALMRVSLPDQPHIDDCTIFTRIYWHVASHSLLASGYDGIF